MSVSRLLLGFFCDLCVKLSELCGLNTPGSIDQYRRFQKSCFLSVLCEKLSVLRGLKPKLKFISTLDSFKSHWFQ